jgi:hypothetical protein
LSRRHISWNIVLLSALALTAAGCANRAGLFDSNEGGWFSKPLDVFAKPDWAKSVKDSTSDLDGGGPVAPDQLVAADGRCSPVLAQAQPAQAASPAKPAAATPDSKLIGSMAGELRSEPAPAMPAAPASPAAAEAPPGAPPVIGGVALGMTECQTVRRAGPPNNVNISAGAKGERRVVLSYLSGPWPGVYHFDNGRLKEIERAPQPAAPAKPAKKKRATNKRPPARTSQREIEYVQ